MIRISGLHLYGDPAPVISSFALTWRNLPGERSKISTEEQRRVSLAGAISLTLIKPEVTPISSLLHAGSATINYRGWHYTGYTGGALTRNPPAPLFSQDAPVCEHRNSNETNELLSLTIHRYANTAARPGQRNPR